MKKKFQTLGLFLLLALVFSMPLSASDKGNDPKVKTLRTEIISLIKKPNLNLVTNQRETVNLSFLVNSKKEIIVVAASTKSNYLENYVKEKLQYQQIKTDFVQLDKIYHIKLTFKKKK